METAINEASEARGGRSTPRWTWVALAIAWVVVVGWIMPLRDALRVGGDEGYELVKAAHLLREGSFPAEIWNDQPLTHTRLYAAMLRVAYGPAGPRAWSLVCSGLLMGAVGYLGSRLSSHPGAGVAAALLVGMAPLTLELSVSAMQEVPVTAFGMLSVVLAVRLREGGSPAVLLVAAGAGALGVAIKLTGVLYVAAAALMLVVPGSRRRRREPVAASGATTETVDIRNRGTWTQSPILYVGLVLSGTLGLLAWLDGRPADALLSSHLVSSLELGRERLISVPQRWVILFARYPQMIPILAWGVVLFVGEAWREGRLDARAIVLPALALVGNSVINPWWTYYGLSVWVAFSALAGGSLAWSWDRVWCAARWYLRSGASPGIGVAVGLVVGVAGVSAALEWVDHAWVWHAGRGAVESRLVRVLAVHEGEEGEGRGCIYAEDPIYAFWSRRPVPPDLLVVTQKRFLGGDLAPEDLARAVERHGCDFVVVQQGSSAALGSSWNRLLAEHYVLTEIAEGQELHVHRRRSPRPYESRLHW